MAIETELSIVIPAFNEARRISRTLDTLREELDSVAAGWEIIVSDDGSLDETPEVVGRHAEDDARIRLVGSGENRGKGAALVTGFRSSNATWVVFLDADLPVPVSTIGELRATATATAADIVVGSRRLPGSSITTPQPLVRRAGGRAFLWCVNVLGFGGHTDPQCGVKLLRRDALEPVIDSTVLLRFGFDVELLTRCRTAGVAVAEHPVTWTHVPGSTLRPARDAANTLTDLVKLRQQLGAATSSAAPRARIRS